MSETTLTDRQVQALVGLIDSMALTGGRIMFGTSDAEDGLSHDEMRDMRRRLHALLPAVEPLSVEPNRVTT
jgi:hypothetical protein